MDELENIIEHNAARSTKVIASDNTVENDIPEVSTPSFSSSSPGNDPGTPKPSGRRNIEYRENLDKRTEKDEVFNLDVKDYEDILGSSIYMGNKTVEDLNNQRARGQSAWDQAGNFLAQAVIGEVVGGTIEGLGYLLDVASIIDVMKGTETEWGNAITDLGQGIREGVQDEFQIHQDSSLKGFDKMTDTGWWFSNGVSVASTFSMMLPVAGATKALSFIGKGLAASKGLRKLKAIDKLIKGAENMSVKAKWMTSGVNQAIMSRNIENFMEAHGTFEDVKNSRLTEVNPKTGKFFTEEEATKSASDAASENYKHGWAMLLQDIPQYLALGRVFNPVKKRMESAVSAVSKKGFIPKMKKLADSKVGRAAITFASEGAEESYQYYIAERAKLRSEMETGLITEDEFNKSVSDLIGDEEMLTSAFFGGLGGNVFSASRTGVDKIFKNKTIEDFRKQADAAYDSRLKNRMEHFQQLNSMKSVAEEMGWTEARDQVVEESMIEMVADALENDKYDQMYETLEGMQNMSEEEIKDLQEKAGIEYSAELAKQSTPGLLKMAEKMKKRYFKLKNMNHSSKVAKEAVKLESRIDISERRSKKIIDNIVELENSLTEESYIDFNLREIWSSERYLQSYEENLKALKERRKNTSSPDKKKLIDMAINNAKNSIKEQKEVVKEAKAKRSEKGERTQAQKEVDAIAEVLYATKKEEISAQYLAARQNSSQRVMDKIALKNLLSEEGAVKMSRLEKDRVLNAINLEGKTIEEAKKILDTHKEDLAQNEIFDENEKEEYTKLLDKKLEDYKKSEEKRKIAEAAEKLLEERRAENARLNEESEGVNNTNRTPLEDVVEDENADEMPLVHDQQMNKSKNELKEHTTSHGLMPLLDNVPTTEAFQEWSVEVSDKSGELFDFKIGEPQSDAEIKALKEFNKAKDYDSIPQEVFDNLPIKAVLRSNPNVFSFITTKPGKLAPAKQKELYPNTEGQRVHIIMRLKAGVEASATVKKSSGGELILAKFNTETQSYPRNNILDLMQIGGNMEKVEILVTDEDGYFMNDRKERDPDLLNQMTVGDDADGNPMPYRGGVFLKVRKANGDYFALRLNLAKNTKEQSDLMSEILVSIAVPRQKLVDGKTVPDKVGGTAVELRDLILGSKVSEMEPELQAKVRELMSEEIDALDSEFKDPLVVDLIQMFAHVGSKTQGKTTELYFENNVLYFDGKKIDPSSRDNSQLRKELSSFLEEKKRRPFNIKLWNGDNNYVEFAINSGLITTNAATVDKDGKGIPLFQNTRPGNPEGRRIQMYMNPVKPMKKSTDPVERSDGKVEIPIEIESNNNGVPVADNNDLFRYSLRRKRDQDIKNANGNKEEIDKINERYKYDLNEYNKTLEDSTETTQQEGNRTEVKVGDKFNYFFDEGYHRNGVAEVISDIDSENVLVRFANGQEIKQGKNLLVQYLNDPGYDVFTEISKPSANTTQQTKDNSLKAKKADIEERKKKVGEVFKTNPMLAVHMVMYEGAKKLSQPGFRSTDSYGRDSGDYQTVSNIPGVKNFKEAEKLVKEYMNSIKPKGWKLGDNYDTSKYDAELASLEQPTQQTSEFGMFSKKEFEELKKAANSIIDVKNMNGLQIISYLTQMPYGDNKLNIAKLIISSGLTIRSIAGNFSLFGGIKISDVKNDENQTEEYKEKLGNKIINFLKTGKQQEQLSFEDFIKNNSEFRKNNISLNRMITELKDKKFSEKFKEQKVYIDFLLNSINSLEPTKQTSEVKADIEASTQDLKDLGIETTYAESSEEIQDLINEGWEEIGITEDGFPKFSRKIKPTQQSSVVEVVSRYTNTDVKNNPNKIYVFGDNTQRKGTGGQAQIRNNENAFGIATKLQPNNSAAAFMSDNDLQSNKDVIDSDIAKIKADGRKLVFPKDGFGTGLAKLKEKAPKTYDYLKQRLQEEFGFNNDTGEVSQQTQQSSEVKSERRSVNVKKDANSFYKQLEIDGDGNVYHKGVKLDPKSPGDAKLINKAMLKVTPFKKVKHGANNYAVTEDGRVFNINEGKDKKVSKSAGKELGDSGTRDAILKKAGKQNLKELGDDLGNDWISNDRLSSQESGEQDISSAEKAAIKSAMEALLPPQDPDYFESIEEYNEAEAEVKASKEYKDLERQLKGYEKSTQQNSDTQTSKSKNNDVSSQGDKVNLNNLVGISVKERKGLSLNFEIETEIETKPNNLSDMNNGDVKKKPC